MKIEVKIPAVGESVQEAMLAQWYRKEGERVGKGELLFLLETDKVTLEVNSEAEGVLHILVREGETVPVGTVVGTINFGAAEVEAKTPEAASPSVMPPKAKAVPPVSPPSLIPEPAASSAPEEVLFPEVMLAPSARELVLEKGLDPLKIRGTGPAGLITRGDVLLHLEETASEGNIQPAARPAPTGGSRGAPVEVTVNAAVSGLGEEAITRKSMSPIRRRIAERLMEAKRNTAMLTTFNEIDMSRAQELRTLYRESFKAKYGVSLGFMSFFVKACVAALEEYPAVNAFIDGQEMVYHHYHHIGMAVGAERGLVVPVIRHAGRLGFAGIEQAIQDYVKKIKENRLELADLEGGTFTITNGGVYGSLLSTPILNFPQSGILGLHKIEDRPVAVQGRVEIRPMMYVALSYDHRVVDGKDAVGFLKRVKECIETPERMMMEI